MQAETPPNQIFGTPDTPPSIERPGVGQGYNINPALVAHGQALFNMFAAIEADEAAAVEAPLPHEPHAGAGVPQAMPILAAQPVIMPAEVFHFAQLFANAAPAHEPAAGVAAPQVQAAAGVAAADFAQQWAIFAPGAVPADDFNNDHISVVSDIEYQLYDNEEAMSDDSHNTDSDDVNSTYSNERFSL